MGSGSDGSSYKKRINGIPVQNICFSIYTQCKGLRLRQPFLRQQQKQELLQNILELKMRLYGLTFKDIRKFAFEFVEHNQPENNFY